jgi:hypothetical protein
VQRGFEFALQSNPVLLKKTGVNKRFNFVSFGTCFCLFLKQSICELNERIDEC